MKKREIPRFESEAQEAEWWYGHREETARWMEEAVAAGKTTTLAKVLERGRKRAMAGSTVSIRIDPTDAARARSLAAKRGLGYKAYLELLLHDALDQEQKQMVG